MSRYVIALNATRTHIPNAGDCPDCMERLDGASGPNGARPSPGDVSCCGYCGCMLKYGPDMAHQRLTDDDIEALPVDVREKLLVYHKAMRQARNQVCAPDGPRGVIVKLPA